MTTIQKLSETDFESPIYEKQDFEVEVLYGLSSTPKCLPTKYLYNDEGTRLFQMITQLPEYYLTRCEAEIMEANKSKLAELMGDEPFNLVELGAGDGQKTHILVEHFLEQNLNFEYVPIDISQLAVDILINSFQNHYPNLKSIGLVAEYTQGIKWLHKTTHVKNLVLFLGSSIGNFNPNDSRRFLQSLWNVLNPDDIMMIGFDLKKDISLIKKAYNDSKGITKEFNINLLKRINNELGGTFNPEFFSHYEYYNVHTGAMESYLMSLKKQTVYIQELKQLFHFEEYEPVHIESSYKYSESDIRHLASQTGFKILDTYFDNKKYFIDSIWKSYKQI